MLVLSRCWVWDSSFYHQAKIVRKALIPYCFATSFCLFIFEKSCKSSFKNTIISTQKNLAKKKYFFDAVLKVTDINSRIRSWIRMRVPNATDPQHNTVRIAYLLQGEDEVWKWTLQAMGRLSQECGRGRSLSLFRNSSSQVAFIPGSGVI
jgi:hypothetical protein